jgi:hypothetical protein
MVLRVDSYNIHHGKAEAFQAYVQHIIPRLPTLEGVFINRVYRPTTVGSKEVAQ